MIKTIALRSNVWIKCMWLVIFNGEKGLEEFLEKVYRRSLVVYAHTHQIDDKEFCTIYLNDLQKDDLYDDISVPVCMKNFYSEEMSESEILNSMLVNLKNMNIQKHFLITLSHRAYLRKTFKFLKKLGTNLDLLDKIKLRIQHHDMSKFTLREAIGYTLRFRNKKDGNVPYVEHQEREHELSDKEADIWQNALQQHYDRNDYHPEHWQGHCMPDDALIESALNCLACILEYKYYGKRIKLHEWFEVEKLENYTCQDALRIQLCLKEWKNRAIEIFSADIIEEI